MRASDLARRHVGTVTEPVVMLDNRALRHVGIVTVQPDYSLKGVLRDSPVAFNLLGVSLN